MGRMLTTTLTGMSVPAARWVVASGLGVAASHAGEEGAAGRVAGCWGEEDGVLRLEVSERAESREVLCLRELCCRGVEDGVLRRDATDRAESKEGFFEWPAVSLSLSLSVPSLGSPSAGLPDVEVISSHPTTQPSTALRRC